MTRQAVAKHLGVLDRVGLVHVKPAGRARRYEVGAEFTYRHPPRRERHAQHYSLQRVVELEPGRRVAWRVTDSYSPGVSEPEEWTGSEIVFDIVPAPGGTEPRFTHVGLVPDVECFDACSTAACHELVTESYRRSMSLSRDLVRRWGKRPPRTEEL